MSETAILGIDLGTTNSACAIWKDGKSVLIPNAHGDYLTPSVIGIDDDGKLLVGRSARERLVSHPHKTVAFFKRMMGVDHRIDLGKRQRFTAVEASALILRSLKHDAEEFLGHPVSHAIISVPAYFNDAQRQATRDAGEIAGLTVNRLINEPTAAALAHGLRDQQEQRFIVLDLGGGTFDVSILEYFDNILEVHSTAGDSALGGEDFTETLLRAFLEKSNLDESTLDKPSRQRLYARAETAKRNIAQNRTAQMTFQHNSNEFAWEIDEAAFRDVCAKLLMRTRSTMERALRDADLAPSAIDDVVLVGGATRMSVFRSLVSRLFGRIPRTDSDPDQTIALGAAVQAGLVARDETLEDVVMTDVCPFSLGIPTHVDEGYGREVFFPLIERNTVVPVSRVHEFQTIHDGQEAFDLRILQGESRNPENNLLLGTLSVPVPRRPAGEEKIAVRFSYDVNSLLEIEVRVLSTDTLHNQLIENRPGQLTQDEKETSLNRLESLKILPRDREEVRAATARAERLYASVLGQEREALGRLIDRFEAVLDTQDIQAIKRALADFSKSLDHFDRDIWN